MVSRTCGIKFFSCSLSFGINKKYEECSKKREEIISRVTFFNPENQSSSIQNTSGGSHSRSGNSITITRDTLNSLIIFKNNYDSQAKTEQTIKDFLTNVNKLTRSNTDLNKVLGARNRAGYCFLSNRARAQRICTIISKLEKKNPQQQNSTNHTNNQTTAQTPSESQQPNLTPQKQPMFPYYHPTSPIGCTPHPVSGMTTAKIITEGSNNNTNNNQDINQVPNPESETPKTLYDMVVEQSPHSSSVNNSISRTNKNTHFPKTENENVEPKTPNTTNNPVLENNINIPTVDEVAKQAGKIVEKGLGLATEIVQERFGQLNDGMNELSKNLNGACAIAADEGTKLLNATTDQAAEFVNSVADEGTKFFNNAATKAAELSTAATNQVNDLAKSTAETFNKWFKPNQ